MATSQDILSQLTADLGLTLSNGQRQNLLAILDTAQARGDDISLAMLGSVAVRNTLEAEYGDLTGAALGEAINRLGEIVTAAEEGTAPPTPEPAPYQALDDALAALQAANEERTAFLLTSLEDPLVRAVLEVRAVNDTPFELPLPPVQGSVESQLDNIEARQDEGRPLTDEQIDWIAAAINGDNAASVGGNELPFVPGDGNQEFEIKFEPFNGERENGIPSVINAAAIANENHLEALNTVHGDADTVLGNLKIDGNDYVYTLEEETPTVDGIFAPASENIQNVLIEEAQAALSEITAEVESAVGEFTFLSGRIDTLMARRDDFEAGLDADVAAEATLESAIDIFNALASAELSFTDAETGSGSDDVNSLADQDALYDIDGATDAGEGTPLLTLDNGTWAATEAGEARDSIDDLLAALQAAYEADVAKNTAQRRFETALERVVEAEDVEGYDGSTFDATAYYNGLVEPEDFPHELPYFNFPGFELWSPNEGGFFGSNFLNDVPPENIDADGAIDIELDLDSGASGGDAPLAEALIELRDTQARFDELLGVLEEARVLDDDLISRDDAIVVAQDVFGDDLDLNLIDLTDDDTYPDLDDGNNAANASSGSDVVLFKEQLNGSTQVQLGFQPFVEQSQGYTLNLFGEQGQDHLFFGDTAYQLVMLDDTQSINDRVGSATELEVFAQQDGANMVFYVESEAAAGTDQNDENVTTLTLTEFSEADIFAFENGRLSTAPVEAA